MSRSYKNVFPKKHWVYSVEGLISLYSVSANTVSNWVRDGLTPSDAKKPHLFKGAVVQRFHQRRKGLNAPKLRPGEFMCLACKGPVFPDVDTVCDNWPNMGKHMYAAKCPDCASPVWKITNETDRDIVADCRNPNTSRLCLHEEDGSVPAGIGISGGFKTADLHLQNDRVIHAWLIYAGRYHVKTVDRHIATIRYFEDLLAGKPFSKLTRDDVAKVRDDLKRRAGIGAADRLSSSSIRHTVSHLFAFLNWLLKQDGFGGLPQDLTDYLELPRAVLASAAPVKQKDYPRPRRRVSRWVAPR